MMTNEEAIAELDKCKGNVEALRMAKCALRANIKIKPKKNSLNYYCPQCEKEGVRSLIGDNHCDGTRNVRLKACPVCASLLDWSEEQ